MTEYILLLKLRRAIRQYPSQNAYADAHNIDRGWLSLVVRGKRHIGPQIAAVLGYEIVKKREYVRKGENDGV